MFPVNQEYDDNYTVPDLGGPPAPPKAKVLEMPAAAPVTSPSPVVTVPITTQTHPLLMPDDASYGWLGDHARAISAPLGWTYCSLLALFAGLGINTNEENELVYPTVYVALLGGVGKGKSLTMKRAHRSLRYHHNWVEKKTPASDRGLIKMFMPATKPAKDAPQEPAINCTLMLDELKNMMNKVNIQGSSLSTTLCTLWSEDSAGVSDVKGASTVNVRLSLLGNLKSKDPEDFRKSFCSESLGGLYDRFIFCPGPTDWEPDYNWDQITEFRAPTQVTVKRPGLPSLAYQMLSAWRKASAEGSERGRIGEIAIRVALISAAANHDSEITEPCMAAALRFAEWQERVRSIYTPSSARNDDAAITGLILAAFEAYEKDNPGEWVRFWDIARPSTWYAEYGSAACTRAKQAMINDGFLIEETEEDERGVRRKHNPKLRLRTM
ncbi:MAG: hypothetical protein JWQ49_95 [Edaphobacter sp.]|nr:hypothetical protein [Edaphobacter sp.]